MPIKIQKMTEEEFRNWLDEQEIDKLDDHIYTEDLIRKAHIIYLQARLTPLLKTEKDYYKNKYLDALIAFGYLVKGKWDEEGNIAQKQFEQALAIERNIPIAHYRLGHILFKKKQFAEALNYFNHAIELDRDPQITKYKLNDLQVQNAKKIISYCSIKIFESYKDYSLDSSMYKELDETLKPYLKQVEDQINANQVVLYKYEHNGLFEPEGISYSEYTDIKEEGERDKESLYIEAYSNEYCVGYLESEEKIIPCLMPTLLFVLGINKENGLKPELFRKHIERLRSNFRDVGLNESLFNIKNDRGIGYSISTDLAIYLFKRIEE
ncbi:MAG: hypothetical protein C0391_04095 [Anaerolinea sp.]|nr:hypothetical protein [Anaerolinea sp.]